MAIKINKEQLLVKLLKEKKEAYKYQKRRHSQWRDNYLLYRLEVEENRLTQREPVCVPLTKGTVKTILSKIDENPEIIFEDKAGDIDKSILVEEKWKEDADNNKFDLLDSIDKKQEALYGRTHRKLNWRDGGFKLDIMDIYDILVDKKTKTHDIDTARYIIERGIYKTLDEILVDERYDADARAELKRYRSDLEGNETTGEQPKNTNGTLISTDAYADEYQERHERLEFLGIESMDDVIAGADTIVELNQHFTMIWNIESKKWIRYVCTVADEAVILRAEPMMDALGVDFWPFETWAGDLEATDYWSDGTADILRIPNQMINTWYAQYMENRTLRNYGMNFYDATATKDWQPQEYDPRPFGWYPLPGKPQDVFQKVDVPDLGESRNDIQFLINIAEKETASTDVEKGAISDAKRTLGEVELAVSKANERITSVQKFYKRCWKDTAEKWYAITIANMGSQKTSLFKKNVDGEIVEKEITKKDIESKKGYKVTSQSATQKQIEQIDEVNNLLAIKKEFPDNTPLNKAVQQRALRISKLDAEEIDEIIRFEEEKQNAPQAPAGVPALPQGLPVGIPAIA